MLALYIAQLLFACWCLVGIGAASEHGDIDQDVVIGTLFVGAVLGVLSFAMGVS